MKKPWLEDPRGRQLEAFVGAQGVKTSQFETADELIFFACALFSIEQASSVFEAASAIEELGKKERSIRAKKNSPHLFPESSPESRSNGAQINPESLQRMMDNSSPQMVSGEPQDCEGDLDIDPAQLLRKVVSAVISAGKADILWEFPEVLAFFNARIPEPHEVAHQHNVDERMFTAKNRWPNRKKNHTP